MRADDETLDREAESIISRNCVRPFEVLPGVFVRCRTRVKSKCPSCAELYRGDWAAIARSGVFDGPVQAFRFYLLTLTAPSFGRVHHVSRARDAAPRKCNCGAV
uniref:replication initiator n=1 Tax=Salinibacterium sp. TaxID=1915057 RepID=UPI0037CA64C0